MQGQPRTAVMYCEGRIGGAQLSQRDGVGGYWVKMGWWTCGGEVCGGVVQLSLLRALIQCDGGGFKALKCYWL